MNIEGLKILRDRISDTGNNYITCSDKLGIHRNTFSNKMSGKASFTVEEASKLIEMLEIDDDNLKSHIFFS